MSNDILNKLGDLLGTISFPETPEERDSAENELRAGIASLLDAINKVASVADDLATRGAILDEKGNSGSIYATRAEGRGIGYREAARLIRSALEHQ